jgi:hypothetical protein
MARPPSGVTVTESSPYRFRAVRYEVNRATVWAYVSSQMPRIRSWGIRCLRESSKIPNILNKKNLGLLDDKEQHKSVIKQLRSKALKNIREEYITGSAIRLLTNNEETTPDPKLPAIRKQIIDLMNTSKWTDQHAIKLVKSLLQVMEPSFKPKVGNSKVANPKVAKPESIKQKAIRSTTRNVKQVQTMQAKTYCSVALKECIVETCTHEKQFKYNEDHWEHLTSTHTVFSEFPIALSTSCVADIFVSYDNDVHFFEYLDPEMLEFNF